MWPVLIMGLLRAGYGLVCVVWAVDLPKEQRELEITVFLLSPVWKIWFTPIPTEP